MPAAADGQRERRSKHDWAAIERDFVTNGMTTAQLSAKYKASERQITRRSVAGDWVRLRHEHVSQVHKAATSAADGGEEWKVEYLAKGKRAAATNALLILAATQAQLRGDKETTVTAAELRQLTASSITSYRALCEALGVAVVPEMGTPDVELPDDPLGDLGSAVAVADPAGGKHQ